MTYRLVLWDFDGTLAHTGGDVWLSLDWAARRCGGTLDASYMADDRNLGCSVAQIYRHISPYPGDDQLERYDALVRTHYREISDYPTTGLYPGIDTLLHELRDRGAANHIVTNKPRQALERILDIKGWSGLFDGWDCADDYNDDIPVQVKTMMIHDAMTRYGTDSARVVMVGDTFSDIAAATANGIDSIAVTYGDGNVELLVGHHPTHRADTVEELADIVRKGL